MSLSNFPGAIDTIAILPDGTVDSTATLGLHAVLHNTVSDAIIAVQTTLGTSPQGSYANVVTRLNNTLIKTPSAGQTLQPSADSVGLTSQPYSDAQASHQTEWRNAAGSSVLAYVDKAGNFSAASLLVAGTALASTNLSDSATLVKLGVANVFTQGQTISSTAGLTLSGSGGAVTLALTSATVGTGFTIGPDVVFTRSAAGVGQFAQLTNFQGSGTGIATIGTLIIGDTANRAYFTADGGLHWTSGSAVTDTNLYRVSASQLQTDYRFNAALDSYARVGGAGQTSIGAFGPSNQAAIQFGSTNPLTLYLSGSNAVTTTGTITAATLNVTNQIQVGGLQITSAALSDIGNFARLNSPTFTGSPLAPTAANGSYTTQIATTAFVINQMNQFLIGPTFTGVPTAPTPINPTSNSQIATTAFVHNVLSNSGGAAGQIYVTIGGSGQGVWVIPAWVSYMSNSSQSTAATGGPVAFGAGSNCTFTPAFSGTMVFHIDFQYTNGSAPGDSGLVNMNYGTGTPPAALASPGGTEILPYTINCSAYSAGSYGSWSASTIVSGLTVGTAYWFDINFYSFGGGTSTIRQPIFTAYEI